jgi:hypothetical protein
VHDKLPRLRGAGNHLLVFHFYPRQGIPGM